MVTGRRYETHLRSVGQFFDALATCLVRQLRGAKWLVDGGAGDAVLSGEMHGARLLEAHGLVVQKGAGDLRTSTGPGPA